MKTNREGRTDWNAPLNRRGVSQPTVLRAAGLKKRDEICPKVTEGTNNRASSTY
jgi:hypothetical protein